MDPTVAVFASDAADENACLQPSNPNPLKRFSDTTSSYSSAKKQCLDESTIMPLVKAKLTCWNACPTEIKIMILKLAIANENSRSKLNVLGVEKIKAPRHKLRDIFKPNVTVIAKLDAHNISPFLHLNFLARELYLKTQVVVFEDPKRGLKLYQTPDADVLMLRYPTKLKKLRVGPNSTSTSVILNMDDLRTPKYNVDFRRIKQLFPNLTTLGLINSSHGDSDELLDENLDSPVNMEVLPWVPDVWSADDSHGITVIEEVREQVHRWIRKENPHLKGTISTILANSALRPHSAANSPVSR